MKISEVTAQQLRLDHVGSIFDGTQDVLVVRVTTDTGLSGLGEVVSSSYVAKRIIEAPRSAGGRHGLREVILGMEATNVGAVWDAMYEASAWYGRRGAAIHAMSGIELALWDLKGKAEGVPVYRLLSDNAASRITAYASVLWEESIEETVRQARQLRNKGFRAVKLGFGPFGTNAEEDQKMMSAVRAALGDEVQLMVDVGRKWDLERAVEECASLAEFNVSWVEEPLHPDDLEGYKRLCALSDIPIAAAETEETVHQFETYLDAGLDVVQPDLGRCGLRTGLSVSQLAEERGRRCVPHCFGTGINTTAAIHWMAATGGDLVEYPMRSSPLCRALVDSVPQLEDGYVSPSDRPGFGIELNTEVLEKYLCPPGIERATWHSR